MHDDLKNSEHLLEASVDESTDILRVFVRICVLSTMCSRWIAVIQKSHYYGLIFGAMQCIPPMFLLLGKNVYVLIIGIFFLLS